MRQGQPLGGSRPLIDEYGPDRREDVQAAITAERRRFDDADVRSFLPVLVERAVGDRIEEG